MPKAPEGNSLDSPVKKEVTPIAEKRPASVFNNYKYPNNNGENSLHSQNNKKLFINDQHVEHPSILNNNEEAKNSKSSPKGALASSNLKSNTNYNPKPNIKEE